MKDRFEARTGEVDGHQALRLGPLDREEEERTQNRGSPEVVRRGKGGRGGFGAEPTPESSPQQCSIGGTDDTSSESTPESPSDLEFMYAFDHASPGLEVHRPAAAAAAASAVASSSSSASASASSSSAARRGEAGGDSTSTSSRTSGGGGAGGGGRAEETAADEARREKDGRSSSEIPTQPMILGRVGDWTARGRKASAVDRAGTPVPTGKAMARRQAKAEQQRGHGNAPGASPGKASRGGAKAALFDTSGLYKSGKSGAAGGLQPRRNNGAGGGAGGKAEPHSVAASLFAPLPRSKADFGPLPQRAGA